MKFWDLNNKDGYITLEFTNHCNLDCIMCDTGKLKKESKKHLSLELFKKIIDDLSKSRFKSGTIVPFWLGEPTLNPRFSEMMDYCSKKLPKIKFEIHTNGTFLNEKIRKAILSNELIERIVISLDAYSKKVYDAIRRNGDFKNVVDNVKLLIKERNKKVHLVFQFIAMPENLNEKEDFIKFWRKEVGNIPVIQNESNYPQSDCIFIRKLDSDLYSEAEFIHKLDKKVNVKSKKFNLFIPYFSVKGSFPKEIYDLISLFPKKEIKRINKIIDLNQPNTKLEKKEFLDALSDETNINIGFSSENNLDNVLDMFRIAKEINPLCKNILVGKKKSFLVDELYSIEEFDWNKIKLEGEEENSKKFSVIMPRLFSKELKDIEEFYSLENRDYEFIDLNLESKSPKNKDIVIFNKSKNSNAVELGAKINTIYLDENSFKIFHLYGICFNKKKRKIFPWHKEVNLIIPKFFGRFPEELYKEAKKIFNEGDDYYDANFSTINPKEGLNIGLWFEGFNCSLMQEFKKTKGKNLVIYFGSEKAKEIFTNPKVDFFIYSADFNRELLKFNDLSRIIFKYGKTIINTEILPLKTKKHKISEKTRERLFEMSISISKEKLVSPELKSINIIMPKFYRGFPEGCYDEAKKLFDPKDNFYDANFSKLNLDEGLNVGFWFEYLNSSLMEEFKKTKGKNLIIYYGKDLEKAKELFLNPQVDYLISSLDFSKKMLSLNDLSKVLTKENINKKINIEDFKRIPASQMKRKELYLLSRSVNNNIIDIDPKKWSDAKWDTFGPEVWEGDKDYKDGLSMVFGENSGYFEYEFKAKKSRFLELQYKICSHSRIENKSRESKSEITLLINNQEIITKISPFYSNRSNLIEKWIISNPPLIEGKNKIKFLIKEKSKLKKGITIYGESLTEEYKHIEMPIRLFLRK